MSRRIRISCLNVFVNIKLRLLKFPVLLSDISMIIHLHQILFYIYGKFVRTVSHPAPMKTNPTKNLFDPEYCHIDSRLKGAPLASFSRRFMAYIIDWAIILLCSEILWLIIPLALVFLAFKRKLRRTLALSRRTIRKNVLVAEQRLETQHIDRKLRRRFSRYMTAYLYILMYAPIVASIIIAVGLATKSFFPEAYTATSTSTASFFSTLSKPVSSLNDAMELLATFFGAFCYFSLFLWKWEGQTPGKHLMNIRVVKLNGKHLSFWNSLERASGYTASAAIFLLGFLQYFWEKNHQTTHDKISETIVVAGRGKPEVRNQEMEDRRREMEVERQEIGDGSSELQILN